MKGEEGKHIFGVCNVNEKGQIVIPKEARQIFNINPGDCLILLGDEVKGGLALVKAKVITDVAEQVLKV